MTQFEWKCIVTDPPKGRFVTLLSECGVCGPFKVSRGKIQNEYGDVVELDYLIDKGHRLWIPLPRGSKLLFEKYDF